MAVHGRATADYLARRGATEVLTGAGIRFPDAGFRPVLAPSRPDWRERPRRLSADIAQGVHGILLGWSVLAADAPGSGFHVYRHARRRASTTDFRSRTSPSNDRSTYLDAQADGGRRFPYFVRPVDPAASKDRVRVEGCDRDATPADQRGRRASSRFTGRERSCRCSAISMATDDGLRDLRLRQRQQRDVAGPPASPVQLEAVHPAAGRSLWRRDVA